MKFLIRFITRNPAGGVEHRDKFVDAPAITIGRATDQTLHLRDKRVRLQHAKIEPQAGDIHITTSALSGVAVNGRSQRDARLVPGDIVEIGSNVLHIIEPENGADFALTFELSSEASGAHFVSDWSNAATGIGGWSKRRLSWTIAGVVLLLALVLPGLHILNQRVWMAGPIHSAHASIGDDCGSCHVTPFERVPDAACIECHTVDRHVASTTEAVLGANRCASCHLEHNEPPQLVKQHQGLCADCHADLPAGSALEPAADFLDAHPAFKVSLLQATTTEEGASHWAPQRLLLDAAQGLERSNLRFDHAVHLDPSGIVTPDGRRVIECAECHVPQPGGARMQPISMVDHCSSCHTLSFDPDDPGREVPHGDAEAVVQALVEYYSARLLGADPDAVEQRVRRPGQALSRADRDRAAAEARVQALQVAEDLFERRTCANCHEVTRTDAEAAVPWQVLPVRLADRYFERASFSHAAHETEVTSCDGCHNASNSLTAQDVLIPGIDTCRDCHGSGDGSRNASAQTPSSCVMCHSFHFDHNGSYP